MLVSFSREELLAMRLIAPVLFLLAALAPVAQAQIETTPIDRAPVSSPQQTYQPAHEPPPVLPLKPQRRAVEAVANGGSGGMSYAGPAGAMNTSPNGSSCAVTCNLEPVEQYQANCNPGFTAMCQCDTAPLAGCRKQ